MKKFVLLSIFLMGLFINSYAQDKILEKVSTMIDTGKQMVKDGVATVDTSSNFKQIYSDVKTGIMALASSLKVGAEHVYGVLVKQQIVYAVVYLIFLLISGFLINNFINKYKDPKEEWTDSDAPSGLGILRIIQVVFGIILFLIGICNIDNIIMGFVNPEYGAIEKILDLVKK